MLTSDEKTPELRPAMSTETDQKAALRQVQRTCAARQDDARQVRAADLRAEHQEDGGQKQRGRRQIAAANPQPMQPGQPIREPPTHQAEHRHAKKRKHGIVRARLQIESADLRQYRKNQLKKTHAI